VNFGRRKIDIDWENLVETGMAKIVGEIKPRRIVLGLREIWVIPPTEIVCLRVRIMWRPWVGHVQVFRWHLLGMKNRILFKDMVWCLTVWTTRIVNWWWVDLLDIASSFVSRASILLIRVTILASTAMDYSRDRSPPLETINCEFLGFSEAGSHCRIFSAKSSNKSQPWFSSFYKNLPWHMVSNRVFVW